VKVSQYADANPASTPTQEVENFYDAFDRRVGKKLSRAGQTDRHERYVYDASDMVLAFEGTSAGLSNADLKHRYLWGEAVDQLLADENLELGLCYFPQADLQGSIVGSGGYAPAANQFGGYNGVDYDPFGNAVGQIYSDTRFRYTGQEWDADAGLYYYNARWYDPHTGQFLSQDPLAFAAGDPNLYRYVGNNVTNLTDPSGLAWFWQSDYVQPDWMSEQSVHLYYVNAGWLWNSPSEYIGTLDSRTGLVTRGASSVPLQSVEDEVSAWGTTGDWGKWFAANNLDRTSPTAQNILHNELPLNRNDRARTVADMQTVARLGVEFYAMAPFCARPAVPKFAGSVCVKSNECVPKVHLQSARQAARAPAKVASSNVQSAASKVEEFLGKDMVVKRADPKGFVGISKDGMRRFRMDLEGHGDAPHAHIEVFDPARQRWIDAGSQHRYYFGGQH
jgi:RHS repeat-associated protein